MFNVCGRNAKVMAFTGENEDKNNKDLYYSSQEVTNAHSHIITKNPYFLKKLQNIIDKKYIFVDRLIIQQPLSQSWVSTLTNNNTITTGSQTQMVLSQFTTRPQNETNYQQTSTSQQPNSSTTVDELDVYEPAISPETNATIAKSNQYYQQNQQSINQFSSQTESKPINIEKLDILYSPMQQPKTIISEYSVQNTELHSIGNTADQQNTLVSDRTNYITHGNDKKMQQIEESLLQSQKQQEMQLKISQRQQHEIEKLQQQLIQQNQLVKQQMKIIQQQQQQILSNQQNKSSDKQLQNSYQTISDSGLKLPTDARVDLSQYTINNSIYTSQVPNISQHTTKQSLTKSQFSIPNCSDPRLTLTTTSLCAFDGLTKLFEINLSQPKIVQFQPDTWTITISYKNMPITIQAQSEVDYIKWHNCIQKCINNARSQVMNKQLLMKLDKAKMLLYIYKNEGQEPDIVYKIGKCNVQLYQDIKNNFGTVKVKCFDGKKFSFSDTLDVCEEWVSKLSTCGGLVNYI